jgi:chorismate mutase
MHCDEKIAKFPANFEEHATAKTTELLCKYATRSGGRACQGILRIKEASGSSRSRRGREKDIFNEWRRERDSNPRYPFG